MRMFSRTPMLLVLVGAGVLGCAPGSSTTPGPKVDAPSPPVTAAANEVIMDVPGMT
jgi:hypothetical protein